MDGAGGQLAGTEQQLLLAFCSTKEAPMVEILE